MPQDNNEEDLRRVKSSAGWQLEQWRRWPDENAWPGVLDVYEAAAFLRVHPWTIRTAIKAHDEGRPGIPAQRIGGAIRIRKVDLVAQQCATVTE
jgi:hypothetical protein